MARLVALSWDTRQLLVATAQTTAGQLWIDEAFSFELDEQQHDFRASISAALRRAHITRGEAVVVVGRGGVEMRRFSVPPAPAEELPDLVRFQARNHFSSLSEKWSLDFVPLSQDGKSSTILAAAISPQLLEQIQSTIEPTGLKLKHIVLRPFAAAELIRTRGADEICRMVVDQMADEADLTVLADGYAVLTRTIRLPRGHSSEELDQTLLQEARHTLAAARNQTGRDATQVLIFGRPQHHASLKQLIEEKLNLKVEFFQPFEAMDVRPSLAGRLPDHAGRFAPLLGGLHQLTSSDTRSLDFLHPRERPVAKTPHRRLWIAGLVGAAVLLIAVGIVWRILGSKQSQITALQQQLNVLDQQNLGADQVIDDVGVIDRWKRGDIDWLDEMYEISARFPLPEEAIVDDFRGSLVRDEGVITLAGRVTDTVSETEIKRQLVERPYTVDSSGTSLNPDDKDYPRSYRIELRINLEERDLIVENDRAENSADSSQQAAGTAEPQPTETDGPRRGDDQADDTQSDNRGDDPPQPTRLQDDARQDEKPDEAGDRTAKNDDRSDSAPADKGN